MITLSLLHPVNQTPVQVWTFPGESTVRIGRSSDNQVVLYSAVVSRYHVELRRVGRTWEVVNLGTNGTYVDGKRINQMLLADGSVIRLARSGPNIQVRLGQGVIHTMAESLSARAIELDPELSQTPTEVATGVTRDYEDMTGIEIRRQ